MLKFLNKRIERELHNKNKDALISTLSFSMFVSLVLLLNIIYGSLYLYFQAYELAFMNFSTASLCLLVIYLAAYKEKYSAATYLFIVVIIYYVLLCDFFLGYEINSVIFLPIVVICVYSIYNFKKTDLIITAMMLFSTYFALLYFRFNTTPKYDSSEFLYIEISNVFISIFCSYFVLYSKQFSDSYLKKVTDEKIKNLSSRASKDFLTGLWNRRYIIDAFENQKMPEEYHVVLADIDFFKKINDSYGHDAGDYILKAISKMLMDYFNNSAFICRWGGEEFVFILQGTNKSRVFDSLEKLRIKISNSLFLYDNEVIQLSMSFGVSHIIDNVSFDDRVKYADEALYFSKENGRNTVTCYDDITECLSS